MNQDDHVKEWAQVKVSMLKLTFVSPIFCWFSTQNKGNIGLWRYLWYMTSRSIKVCKKKEMKTSDKRTMVPVSSKSQMAFCQHERQ